MTIAGPASPRRDCRERNGHELPPDRRNPRSRPVKLGGGGRPPSRFPDPEPALRHFLAPRRRGPGRGGDRGADIRPARRRPIGPAPPHRLRRPRRTDPPPPAASPPPRPYGPAPLAGPP